MKTISEKEINLSDIVIFNQDQNDPNKIAIIYFNSEGKFVADRILYSEATISTLIKDMRQIKSLERIKNGENHIIKVTYEDGLEAKFNESRQELLNDIFEKQKELKNSDVINDTWDILTEEEKTIKKDNYKKRRKNGLIAGIVAASLLIGTGAHVIASKKNNKDDDDNSYESIQNMTQQEIEENKSHSSITIRDDREYAFDINDPEIILKKGLELYKETTNKNLLLLTSGEIVKWDETLSTEVVEYINGLTPSAIKVMDLQSGKAEMEKIEQAILLINAAATSAENDWDKETVNLSKYVADEYERNIMNNSLVYARRIHDAAVGNPLNGKIIDSDEEFNKVNRRYINAESAMLYYIKDTMNDPYYLDAPATTRWTIVSTLRDGLAIVRRFESIDDISKEEQRNAEYPVVYYIDNVNNTTWYPVVPENRKQVDIIGQEVYKEYNIELKETGAKKSDTEMEEYYEKNANIVKLGIEKELDDERVRAENDFIDIMLIYNKANLK